jgi:hypothetical protein
LATIPREIPWENSASWPSFQTPSRDFRHIFPFNKNYI